MQFPGLDIRPREAVTRKLIGDLVDGRLDAAIVALPVSEAALQELALFEEEFVLVRPDTEAGKPVPDAAMLKTMRLLLLEEGHCFREQALSYCKLSASAPRDLMEASSLSTLVQMVGAGIGVTLIPEMAVPIETRSAAIALARLPVPRPTRMIGMVWRKTSPLAAQLTQLAEIVRQSGTDKGRKPKVA
jgi:LysR family hydrogen peroxide-inducible transcriptional activator